MLPRIVQMFRNAPLALRTAKSLSALHVASDRLVESAARLDKQTVLLEKQVRAMGLEFQSYDLMSTEHSQLFEDFLARMRDAPSK